MWPDAYGPPPNKNCTGRRFHGTTLAFAVTNPEPSIVKRDKELANLLHTLTHMQMYVSKSICISTPVNLSKDRNVCTSVYMRLNFMETSVYREKDTHILYNYNIPGKNIRINIHILTNKIYDKCTFEYPFKVCFLKICVSTEFS